MAFFADLAAPMRFSRFRRPFGRPAPGRLPPRFDFLISAASVTFFKHPRRVANRFRFDYPVFAAADQHRAVAVVFTGPERRRRWSEEQKWAIVAASLSSPM
jgi:hypothetical protein